ncbi:MAG TPA: ABC transporter permease [Chitinophaga sp.]|nr:ABC transporter permease [Chitinophaga sp.]
MFRSYLKVAMRNLFRNKAYNFLNIFGLAIGIVCAGVIFLWVEDEITFDHTHEKRDRIYAVLANWDYSGYTPTFSTIPALAGPEVKRDIPGIKDACRLSSTTPPVLFNIGDKSVYASGRYVDASLFNIFTLPFTEGNAATAFKDLYSIVVTQRTAKKLFGVDKDVVGRRVKMDNKQEYIVGGVLKDIPENSSIRFEWVAPFQIFYQQNSWLSNWTNNAIDTYVELEPAADPAAIDKKLYNFIQQRAPEAINHLFLFNMNKWRLYGNFVNGKPSGGRIQYVRMFSIIAWIILLIACINFMNLATARSEKRAREVGVRKVMGANRKGLVVQFIGEALIMAALACFMAVLIITLVLPACNALMDKNLSLGLEKPLHIAALLLIIFICGLVAGSYPSLYLSSFRPVAVLKGFNIKEGGVSFIRRGLVVLQFTVSIILIICTAIIYQQIQHVKNRDLGFNKDLLLSMNIQGNMLQHFDAIRQDLLNTGLVENAALTDHETIYGGNNTSAMNWRGKPQNESILVSQRMVSPEFVKTSGMQLIEGRDFYKESADSSNVIITESLAKLMGEGSAVGKTIETASPFGPDKLLVFKVVGVLKDYVYGDMYTKSDPVVLFCYPPVATLMYVRLKPAADPVAALSAVEKVMTVDNPGYPFAYTFVNDQFNNMFQTEMLVGRLSRVFALLAILISCLGLFGLAAYTAERRTREIGIRKVLGASVTGITALLSRDFLRLVGIACVIGFPLAWWAMSVWLQGYAYRVSIHWWVFVMTGVTAILISLLTVSFQAIRAALMNPVKSLKAE